MLAGIWGACTIESVNPQAKPAHIAAKKAEGNVNTKESNGNSLSNPGDYTIQASNVGKVWTYKICKNEGAKDISHVILDLENCDHQPGGLTIDNIKWATVNGADANLSNSEGNTGCELTTLNFVKFDDLDEPGDDGCYTIVFELNKPYGNTARTNLWIKAGNACNVYENVKAPCCY
jgi:hypothetical protein